MEHEKLQIVLDLYKAGHIDFAKAKILLSDSVNTRHDPEWVKHIDTHFPFISQPHINTDYLAKAIKQITE